MTHLETRDIKSARKRHQCDYCYGWINKGKNYHRYTGVYYDNVYHLKQCKMCIAFGQQFPDHAQNCCIDDVPDYYTDEYIFKDHESWDEFAAEYILLEEDDED